MVFVKTEPQAIKTETEEDSTEVNQDQNSSNRKSGERQDTVNELEARLAHLKAEELKNLAKTSEATLKKKIPKGTTEYVLPNGFKGVPLNMRMKLFDSLCTGALEQEANAQIQAAILKRKALAKTKKEAVMQMKEESVSTKKVMLVCIIISFIGLCALYRTLLLGNEKMTLDGSQDLGTAPITEGSS